MAVNRSLPQYQTPFLPHQVNLNPASHSSLARTMYQISSPRLKISFRNFYRNTSTRWHDEYSVEPDS